MKYYLYIKVLVEKCLGRKTSLGMEIVQKEIPEEICKLVKFSVEI